MHQVGERVGVILGWTPDEPKVIKFLGYGIYDGDLPGGPLGSYPNPRITLEKGGVIWGCECWWGSEEEIKATLERHKAQGYTIREITLERETTQ